MHENRHVWASCMYVCVYIRHTHTHKTNAYLGEISDVQVLAFVSRVYVLQNYHVSETVPPEELHT